LYRVRDGESSCWAINYDVSLIHVTLRTNHHFQWIHTHCFWMLTRSTDEYWFYWVIKDGSTTIRLCSTIHEKVARESKVFLKFSFLKNSSDNLLIIQVNEYTALQSKKNEITSEISSSHVSDKFTISSSSSHIYLVQFQCESIHSKHNLSWWNRKRSRVSFSPNNNFPTLTHSICCFLIDDK
jgi:hypothetical protein